MAPVTPLVHTRVGASSDEDLAPLAARLAAKARMARWRSGGL